MTQPHQSGDRVCSVFDENRQGVVIESDATKTLIEFEDYDQDERRPFTHRIWLPTRHWKAAAQSSEVQPLGSAERQRAEDGLVRDTAINPTKGGEKP